MTADRLRLRAMASALAGGGAGLVVIVLSFWPWLLLSMLFRSIVGPLAGFGGLGLACGLAAGYTSASFWDRRRVSLAFCAWAIWALGIAGLLGAHAFPSEFGWVTLLAGLAGALVAAGIRAGRAEQRAASGFLAAGLLGALGGFAILTLGIAALGYAAQLEWVRPRGVRLEYYVDVYLRGMGAALWAVIILATALSGVLPIAAGGWTIRNPAGTMGLALVLFLALGALAGPVLDFYIGCTVGSSLSPFVWLTRGSNC